MEELLVDDRTLTTRLFVGLPFGDGRLHAAHAVRHHDVDVAVIDRARELDGVSVACEDARRRDAVPPVDGADDGHQARASRVGQLHQPRHVPPREDDEVELGVRLGAGAFLGGPVLVLGHGVHQVVLAERTRPRKESRTIEEVEPVVTGARQDGARGLGEARDNKECQNVLPVVG